MVKVIIIPDVHGRTFWKDVVEKYSDSKYDKVPIVFLGDYLDPYDQEDIRFKDAFTNFKEIVEFKRNNPDRVILLLGNHDLHYINTSSNCRSSRYDRMHSSEIRKIFMDNLDVFQLMWKVDIDSITYVFSHAGITLEWLQDYNYIFNVDCTNIIKAISTLKINDMFHNDETIENVLNTLSAISYYRGGWAKNGSMVWEDLTTFLKKPKEENFIQIFGHTQLRDTPVNIENSYYDLDVRRGFIINDKNVCELNGDIIANTL